MNKKGQALVEFIIILPILLFIMLAILDYGLLYYNKTKLENIITEVSKMYNNNEPEEEINNFIKSNDKNLKYTVTIEDKYTNIKLYKEHSFITPGIEKIFNNNIIVERKVYNE
ncbi:MAG: pilus assembly protein [Bacilli bacterium]|nr:pilus assembly protein [Bacilli bacterium]